MQRMNAIVSFTTQGLEECTATTGFKNTSGHDCHERLSRNRIAMNAYPEIEMLLYVALFATAILLVLYWLIRKAVKDGISDSQKHKSDSD